MPVEVYITRNALGRMEIADANSMAEWEELPIGRLLKCSIVAPRNQKHSRQFFALLRVIYEAQEFFPSFDNMRKQVLIGTGFYTMYRRFNGDEYPMADSMAFDKMDDVQFNAFFDKFVVLCDDKILPNIGEQAIRDLWEEILIGNSDKIGSRKQVRSAA